MNSDVQDLHVLPTTFPTRLACDLCSLPCEGRGGLGRGAFGDQPEPRAPPSSLPLPSQGEGPRQMPQSSTRSGGSGGASPSSPHTSRHMRSEEHTSELQSLMRISYAVFGLTKYIQDELHTTH